MKTMTARHVILGLVLFTLAGCQQLDGDWAPACDAFAGDRLSFSASRYTWDKFTDARRVDSEGEVIDPFPDYPKSGFFEQDGAAIVLLDDSADEIARFYIHESDGVTHMLTAAEQASYTVDGSFPDCTLQQTISD